MPDPILYWNEAALEVNARDHTPVPAGSPPPLPKAGVDERAHGLVVAFALVNLR